MRTWRATLTCQFVDGEMVLLRRGGALPALPPGREGLTAYLAWLSEQNWQAAGAVFAGNVLTVTLEKIGEGSGEQRAYRLSLTTHQEKDTTPGSFLEVLRKKVDGDVRLLQQNHWQRLAVSPPLHSPVHALTVVALWWRVEVK